MPVKTENSPRRINTKKRISKTQTLILKHRFRSKYLNDHKAIIPMYVLRGLWPHTSVTAVDYDCNQLAEQFMTYMIDHELVIGALSRFAEYVSPDIKVMQHTLETIWKGSCDIDNYIHQPKQLIVNETFSIGVNHYALARTFILSHPNIDWKNASSKDVASIRFANMFIERYVSELSYNTMIPAWKIITMIKYGLENGLIALKNLGIK